MNWRDALELVVAETGVGHYRFLCSEANPDPSTREGYRRYMVELATGVKVARPEAPPPASPRPPPGDWSARIRACPDFNPGCCASPAPYCSRFDLHPSRERCIECLRGEDE